jgi:NOL1/NOP2/fmu family ribosome biogenesis protein
VPGKGVYAAGVNVGSVTKGRLVPHHQFFSAYGDLFQNRIDLAPDDRNLAAYLHGDTIPADFSGWGVVSVCGAAIGGVKASGGVAKNHYPKGLRR